MMLPKISFGVLCAIFAAIALWIAVIIASGTGWNPFGVSWSFANTGAFGDSFGPLSAFMAGLAALSAIGAFQEQKNEIRRLQLREKDDDHRRDLDFNEQKQRRLEDDVNRQEQREEATFFQLLQTFQTVVGETDIVSANKTQVGRDAFRSMVASFQSTLSLRDNPQDTWRDTSVRYQNDLNHYFRLMYHIVVFVDSSTIKEKARYIKILRALLSESELTLLALNCAYGEGREKFKDLVEKYALLHSLSSSVRGKWGINREFLPSAFGT